MNKEELNKEIEKLNVSLKAHEEQVNDLKHDLKIATQRLEDCDKPKLTQKQFAELHRVIETSVENFDFNQADCYNVELGMDYDNKVYLESIEFEYHSDFYLEPVDYNLNNSSSWRLSPQKNMLVLFPSYLKHKVNEHKGTKPHKHPHEENEKEVVKDGKTETGKKPATIDLKPKLDDK